MLWLAGSAILTVVFGCWALIAEDAFEESLKSNPLDNDAQFWGAWLSQVGCALSLCITVVLIVTILVSDGALP